MAIPLSEISFGAKLFDVVRRLLRRPSLSFLPFDPEHNLATWDLRGSVSRIQRVFTVEVRNDGEVASRCVAFLEIWPAAANRSTAKYYALHWADTDYAYRTSGADPIDIGPEGRRADVAFTFSGQPVPGCWVGTKAALVLPVASGDYLPPGEYHAEIQVKASNTTSSKACFRLLSPASWDGLTAEPVKSFRSAGYATLNR